MKHDLGLVGVGKAETGRMLVDEKIGDWEGDIDVYVDGEEDESGGQSREISMAASVGTLASR